MQAGDGMEDADGIEAGAGMQAGALQPVGGDPVGQGLAVLLQLGQPVALERVTSRSSRAQLSPFPGTVASRAIFRSGFCFFFLLFAFAQCCPQNSGERGKH